MYFLILGAARLTLEVWPSAREVRAVVSKRGVDDGNQKGGGFLQPAQESHIQYNTKKPKVKNFFKDF
jgi:hypothetical protein